MASHVRNWAPFDVIDGKTGVPIILIILNTPNYFGETLERLWKKAWLKLAVDGGANLLYQFCKQRDSCHDQFLPDIISGDFDSATNDVISFYESKGVSIVHTPDQNETDFTKSLRLAGERLSSENRLISGVVALADMWGRTDQVFANFATLYQAEKLCRVPVYLVSSISITWLLSAGRHRIAIPSEAMNGYCGLIPLGGPCLDVTTTGLKWNLDHSKLQFGQMVSTSNAFVDHIVTVETDNHLLFTTSRPSEAT